MRRHQIIAAGCMAAAVAAAGAGPAHADPRITVEVKKGVTSSPFQYRYNLHLPVLSGAKRKAERTVSKIVGGITDQQLQFLLRWRNRVSPSPECRSQNSQIRTRTRKDVVAGRYATATILASTWPACGGWIR